MEGQSPIIIYQQQIEKYSHLLKGLVRKRNRVGWLRLIVFVATVIISFKVFTAFALMGLIPLFIGFGLFVSLIFIDADNNEHIANTSSLIKINEEEIKIIQHDFLHRFDGEHILSMNHDYAQDLDIFGKASLFQWGNRCATEQGKILFANNLLKPLQAEQIPQRQLAVMELAQDFHWRQQFQSFAEQSIITVQTEERTHGWLSEEDKYFKSSWWKIVVWVYTVCTLGSVVAVTWGLISSGTFLFLFALYFVVSMLLSRNTIRPYLQLSRIVGQITTVEKLIRWIEVKPFRSEVLHKLQRHMNSGSEPASLQLKALKKILDKFDLRLNIAGPLFLNSFLLWDVRQMMALNEWRRKNRKMVPQLFKTIAEMEVLNSLAVIRFNHPGWCTPEFSPEHFILEAIDLGHPLIPEEQRVDNSFGVDRATLITLITGSNMAGKSTFLRSIGVNIVLAQMGAPVCAKRMLLSPVRLMSSMRISDNLAENTSTFYAELKKLKTIIEAVNGNEKVFVLLDEILRGTNSHDRHKGSEALIAQLIRQHAFAVIATHDLALAGLQKDYPGSIRNYHFDVQVKGDELFFDYRLKKGICQSLNASLLMKKIGIEL